VTIAPWRNADSAARHARRRPLGPAELLEVAEGLAHSADSWPGLDDPVERCWRTIAITDRLEAWVVAWPVGGAIELHDHGDSGGAVVVASGLLVETSLHAGADGRLATRSTPVGEGGHVVFGPGHVHDMVNDGPGPALSVHVYTPALRSMTFFDSIDDAGLVAVRTEHYRDGLLVG
jgi:mannose-6-phosphate isomerase-like protein (cupin superfamily)